VSFVETLVLGYIIQTFWRLDLFDKRVDTDDDVDVDDNNDEEFEMKQEEGRSSNVNFFNVGFLSDRLQYIDKYNIVIGPKEINKLK